MRGLRRLTSRMRGRVGAAGLFVLAAAVAAFPAAAATGATEPEDTGQSAEDDGFRVESRRPEDYYGTREDVESNVTDDLAAKLRQFDEWTLDGEDQTAADAAQQAAAAAATAAAAAAGGGAGVGGAGGGPAAAGNPNSGSPPAHAGPFDPNATATPTGAPGANARPGARQPSPPIRPDRRAKEDDVARMIREAAEQETDPARRRELLDQYEAYVDSL